MGASKIKGMMARAHDNAVKQGNWDDELDGCGPDEPVDPSARGNLERLMLVVTDVTKAAAAVRRDDPENFGEKLAGVCIGVFDLAQANNVDLEAAIIGNLKLGELRSRMRGKMA